MIVFGIVLLLVGYIVHISILETIGMILLAIGIVLYVLGSMGRPVGGRRHYW
jgi:Ca2+/Na+ antiporter